MHKLYLCNGLGACNWGHLFENPSWDAFGLLKTEAAFVTATKSGNKRLNLNQCGSQLSGTMGICVLHNVNTNLKFM